MKVFFFCFIAILFFNLPVNGQNTGTPGLTLQDEEIITVNKLVSEIKAAISGYQKKEKSKDVTGYRNAFFAGGELKVISSMYKDTSSEKHGDWYFQNGNLIYSEKLWTDVKTKDTLDYERYYLSNERLIAWFKFDNSVGRNHVAFKKLNHRMRDYISDLKRDNEK